MPYPFQIFQSKDYTFFAYEYAGAVRNIYMKDPGRRPADSWMGQSVGRWEGDTLVVDVDGLQRPDLVRPLRQSPQRQTQGDRALYAARPGSHLVRSDDRRPETFTRPWKIAMPLYRRVEPNAQLMQFKCVEFVEELMYGHLRKKPTQPASKETPK